MTLTQMEFARAVAQHRSFSKAAAACNVSQPSLSNAVAKLEMELGGPLFVRTTRQVTLTPAGDRLLPLIHGVLESSALLSAAAATERNPERPFLRVGLSPLVSTGVLAAALRPFESMHSDLKLVLKQCMLEDLRERLDQRLLDVAVVPKGFFKGRFERCFFYADTLQYLPAQTGAEDRSPTRIGISVREASQDTFLLTADGCGLTPLVRELFRKEGCRLREYPGVALNYQVIEEWVALGIGSGLLPKEKVHSQKNRAIPLLRRGKPVLVPYELIWLKQDLASDAVKSLVRHFETVVPSVLAGSAMAG